MPGNQSLFSARCGADLNDVDAALNKEAFDIIVANSECSGATPATARDRVDRAAVSLDGPQFEVNMTQGKAGARREIAWTRMTSTDRHLFDQSAGKHWTVA